MSQPAGIIAIDGQVAAGKTAAGRALARRLDCPYLDTGIMYRAVAWLARRDSVDVTDTAALGQLAAAPSQPLCYLRNFPHSHIKDSSTDAATAPPLAAPACRRNPQ